jgi:serine protease Do
VKVKVENASASDDEDGPSLRGERIPPQLREFFRRYGENGVPQRPRSGSGVAVGSGFFVSADGYVVTNNHVVEHGTKVVSVVTDDGRTLDAKVVGADPKSDIAVLKVTEGGNFPYVKFAPVTPRVGDWVVAIGNPFGLGGTVTSGIVSARGRDIGAGPYDDFLQIDAPINKGNSGGPTFNLRGEVVGVNTAIASPSGGSRPCLRNPSRNGAERRGAARERRPGQPRLFGRPDPAAHQGAGGRPRLGGSEGRADQLDPAGYSCG